MDTDHQYKVAVGIDACPDAGAALEWAAELAKRRDGSVTALTAWNYPTPLMMPLVGVPLVPAEFVENKARETLRTIRASASTGHVAVEERVVMGTARSVLVEASTEHDLLVLGRSGNSRLQRAWLGSTAGHCARTAHCPVAIVRASDASEKRVTVAIDGSDRSARGLEWALSTYGAAAVTAVYSFEEWELKDMAKDHRVRSEIPAALDERVVAIVAQAAIRAGLPGTDVRYEIRRGDPRVTIVDGAQRDEVLVLGSHGQSALARWLLGSVADYAIHHAPGTVVIWRSAV